MMRSTDSAMNWTFPFEELQRADGLQRLDEAFAAFLGGQDPDCLRELGDFRNSAQPIEKEEISDFLLKLAPWVEQFIADVFDIKPEMESQRLTILSHDPVMAYKQEFVLNRARRYKGDIDQTFSELNQWLDGMIGAADHQDRELAVARLAVQCLENASGHGDVIEKLTHWTALALRTADGAHCVRHWAAFDMPHKLDPMNLVPVETIHEHQIDKRRSPVQTWRKRDGFKLTDGRMNAREVQGQVHYCVYCHDHGGDFCSRGFPEKKKRPELGFKVNPLGVLLTGCPLDERISEMNVLRREGRNIAALAMIMADNPMVPATGHRICNDCMKSCIYQKQDPVNIPEIETRILTDVLALPWGVEIYHLLARWNPLRARQFRLQPWNGRKVLVAGMGPAGFSMAHHLTMEGCAVLGIDGLKIEPLPDDWLNRPVKDWNELVESLDERINWGFGGVAEYGITVRWDKNFLKLVYLTLARRQTFDVYGGIRLGGTLTLEDAWDLGFDHICYATGAGLPRVLHIDHSMARGMRQASDFLMALQSTGAAKADSLSSLQVQLPALVIGGGLTAVDTATEVQAYYVCQVEETLSQWEDLCAREDEALWKARLSEEDHAILDRWLEHGREVRFERRRAQESGQAPDFIPLLNRWGGVTLVYRRGMADSPAYVRNHEELTKAMEEGLHYVEGHDPIGVEVDSYQHVQGMIFRRMQRVQGRWLATNGETILPARSIFVAAGTVPNTIYEREHPGSIRLDGRHFAPHMQFQGKLHPVDVADHCKSLEVGALTSYDRDRHRVSFLGDAHPVYAGSVVKAIASAKRCYPQVLESLELLDPPKSSETVALEHFFTRMRDAFGATIHAVRATGAAVELLVKAPLTAKSFRSGQFFRMQSYETGRRLIEGSKMMIPPMTVSGAGIRDDLVRLLILQWKPASKLAGRFQPGDPLVLMGPTGEATEIPEEETVMVIAASWGAAAMLDLGVTLKTSGNRVLLLMLGVSGPAAMWQDELESASDQIVWSCVAEKLVQPQRVQDISLVEPDIVKLLQTYDAMSGNQKLIPLNRVNRILIMAGTGLMEVMHRELSGGLLMNLFDPQVKALGTAASPMQCMLKGVCAQCLHWQIDPQTGERTQAVFSCAHQEQPIAWIDFENLAARQQQNRLAEQLRSWWFQPRL